MPFLPLERPSLSFSLMAGLQRSFKPPWGLQHPWSDRHSCVLALGVWSHVVGWGVEKGAFFCSESLLICSFPSPEVLQNFPKAKERVLSLAFVFYSIRTRDKCSLKGLSHMSCHLSIYLELINYKTVLDFLLFLPLLPRKSTNDSEPQK